MLRGRTVHDVVRAIGRGGPSLVQVRGKGMRDADLLAAVREAVGAAHPMGMKVVVNDRPDVALLAGADGVHVGQEDLPPSEVRRLLPDAIVGLSVHTEAQVNAAADEPVDYVAYGPVFATWSASEPAGSGLERLGRAVAAAGVPLVVAGGVQDDALSSVLAAGVAGLAVLSAVMNAADPEAAAARLHERLARGSIPAA